MAKIIKAAEMVEHFAPLLDLYGALKRIEELEKAHEAFRQEVSDAVEKLLKWPSIRSQQIITSNLARFIIAKPDPLVEALKAIGGDDEDYCNYNTYAEELRAALAARGLEIREIEK